MITIQRSTNPLLYDFFAMSEPKAPMPTAGAAHWGLTRQECRELLVKYQAQGHEVVPAEMPRLLAREVMAEPTPIDTVRALENAAAEVVRITLETMRPVLAAMVARDLVLRAGVNPDSDSRLDGELVREIADALEDAITLYAPIDDLCMHLSTNAVELLVKAMSPVMMPGWSPRTLELAEEPHA